jgi:ATP-binding cassette, subfamily B, multidrug efflux pump
MIRSLLRLKGFVGRYRWRLAAGIAAFGISRVLEALVPLLLGFGIDRIAAGRVDLGWIAVTIFAVVAVRYGVVTFARYAVRSTGQHVAFDLRQALYDSLQQQGSRFFARYTIGDMMTRAVADIGLIQRLIAMGTILLVILVYASLVGFGFMLYLSPSLTLLLLPPLPFVFFYAKWSARQMGVASRDVQDRLSDLGAHVQENLSGIRTIQAMVQEENEIRRFAATNQDYADAFYRQAQINSMMTAVMPTLAAICVVTILGYGGYLVLEGYMTIGVLVAFSMYVNMVVQPFRVAGFIINLFQRAAVASDRLFEVLSLPPEIEDRPSGATPQRIRGEIEFRNLDYTFPGAATPTLDGVSLRIAPGESVAIMGRVGAGKTTLLRLLVRLLDPPPGSIFVDGHDVRDYPLAQLRAQIAMVPQDPFLFGEPLRDNLTYDDPSRHLDAVWQAAEAADLKATIESFPDGMGTLVGERGVTLSGGQKQRATLARGLIRQAPVLVLDDCFSSVDTGTEDHILDRLGRWRAGLTTLLVSHRVSTARHCDRIVVLHEGRIAEVGSHDELIALGGIYAELERIQREGADEGDFDFIEVPG